MSSNARRSWFWIGLLGLFAVPSSALGKGGPGAGAARVAPGGTLLEQNHLSALLASVDTRRRCPVPLPAACNDVRYRFRPCGRAEYLRVRVGRPTTAPTGCALHCATPPTARQCRDQRWYNSICGLLERKRMSVDATFSSTSAVSATGAATCTNELMAEATSSQIGFNGLSTIDLIVPPLNCTNCSSTVGARSTARQQPYDRDDQQIVALQTFYSGHTAEAFTNLSKSSAESAVYRAVHAGWRAEWEANNNALGGTGAGRLSHACYEYVYEKYYDWGRFTDASASLGDDFRAVYDVVYAQSPALSRSNIGRRGLQGTPLQQRNGTNTAMGFQFDGTARPKNVFFGPEYALKNVASSGAEFIGAYTNIRIEDPVFAARLLQLQAAAPRHDDGWSWHNAMGQALMPAYLDHEFEFFDEKVAHFQYLLSQRLKLTIAIDAYVDALTAPPVEVVNDPLWDPTVVFVNLINNLAQFDGATRTVRAAQAYRNTLGSRAARTPAVGLRAPSFDINGLPFNGATPIASIYTPGGSFIARTGVAQNTLATATRRLIPYASLESFLLNLDDVSDLTIQEMTALANGIDLLIEAALKEADALGCLDASGPTACDWSPRRFKARLEDPYTASREVDFAECMEVIGGGDPDFVSVTQNTFLHPQYNPPCPNEPCPACPLVGNTGMCRTRVAGADCAQPFTNNPDRLEFYMACYDRWLIDIRQAIEQAVGEPLLDKDGNLQLGKMASDGTDIGGDMFGVSFSFMGGWGLDADTIPDFDVTPNPSFCGLDPYIIGTVNAGAKVFYQDVALVDALVDVEMQSTTNEIHLELLDETIFTVPGDDLQFTVDMQPTSNGTEEGGDKIDETFFSYGTTIVIVWVPVSLEAGLRGFLGLRGGAAAEVTSCANGNLSLGGHLTPYAGVEGYAEASIDALVVEAGVTGVLQIIRVDLPLETRLSFVGQPGPMGKSDSELSVQTSLEFVMTLLSGYFAGFVEVCYLLDCERAEAKIFSWEGPSIATTLFDTSFSVGLVPLDAIRKAAQ